MSTTVVDVPARWAMPDPVSGMHRWHQAVRNRPVERGDRYGDMVVDAAKAREAYRPPAPARPEGPPRN